MAENRKLRTIAEALEILDAFESDLLSSLNAAISDMGDEGWGDTLPEFKAITGSVAWSDYPAEYRQLAKHLTRRLFNTYEIEEIEDVDA